MHQIATANKYNPPLSGVGGFSGGPVAPVAPMRDGRNDPTQYAQKACDNKTTAPKEQTVGETLRGVLEEHLRQAKRLQDALWSTPESVLQMPLSQFRRLSSLL